MTFMFVSMLPLVTSVGLKLQFRLLHSYCVSYVREIKGELNNYEHPTGATSFSGYILEL